MVRGGIVRTMSGGEPTTERALSAAGMMDGGGGPTTAQWQNGKSCSDMWRHTGPLGLQMRSGCAALAPVCMYNPHPKHVWRYFHSQQAKKTDHMINRGYLVALENSSRVFPKAA